jgi:hypothetical protein
MNFGFNPINELKSKGLKLLAYLEAEGIEIEDFNIVYFEGLNTDLETVNADRLDEWNDVRAVITRTGDVLMAAVATTEPGRHYTVKPMNANGAARIAFGLHEDCWAFGDHFGQDALVQVGMVKVHRDLNQDGFRTGDKIFVGDNFGLNQHTTSNAPEMVGRWSAGCLVGRFLSTHKSFMAMCRASKKKRFSAIIVDGTKFASFKG